LSNSAYPFLGGLESTDFVAFQSGSGVGGFSDFLKQSSIGVASTLVADALSRKERVKPRHVRAMAMTIQSGVKRMILADQSEVFKEESVLAERLHGLYQQMEKKEDESLYFMDCIWIPLVGGVRTIIIDEAYKTRDYVHQGADKMYYDLRDMYWWPVDRMTKSAYFLATHEDYSMEKLARLYIDEIVARHRVPVLIILDRDGRFTSRFWQTLKKALGTRIDMSTAYHPQTDGQNQSEAFKEESALAERLHGLYQQMEKKEDESLYFMDCIWISLVGGVRTIIIDEAYKTRDYVHQGADKMYY
nr:reverse transcriptase domain-containing protein [Tanacetum cinerariifolium]